jgi:hypothetical protein
MRLRSSTSALWLCLAAFTAAACGDDGGGGGQNENEVITTVTLTFTPAGGGAAVVAAFDDPDGDGGQAPTVTPINLTNGISYTMAVRFQNKLETPPEEITDEVNDEAVEHQIFLTGSAVKGPATSNEAAPLTHSYADTDAGGLPIGLANTIVAATGTGQLILTLRHLPPVNDTPVKVEGLATQVRNGGISSIGGDTDVQVTFTVTVP